MFCRGNTTGRTVFSANGLGLEAHISIPKTIAQCIAETHDVAFIPHEQAEAAKEEDGDNEDPAELEQHVELAVEWNSRLHKYASRDFSVKETKPVKPLDKVEQRGYDSEALIAETLEDTIYFPWITSAKLQAHNSDNDAAGIDIIVTVAEPIATWLHSRQLSVQVKSDPYWFPQYLERKQAENKLSNLTATQYLLQRRLILLNGGGGGAALQGIVGPFICQMYQLIEHTSGAEVALEFINHVRTTSPKAYALTVKAISQDVIARDYGEVISTQIPI